MALPIFNVGGEDLSISQLGPLGFSRCMLWFCQLVIVGFQCGPSWKPMVGMGVVVTWLCSDFVFPVWGSVDVRFGGVEFPVAPPGGPWWGWG